ncbi:tRNA (adenosine(37)-N6)-threonylcarbamoyltransferase complex transferase subunit TsaD [Peptoniphilus sp. GNH]|nr:putative glycoprotease GCP [Clostridiales bacterium KA00134]UHR02283.1 tRNA (adenosine(37)-N6)-threonylcarbamoyltransferase complex transferase subunit TsaD [Peptoniphilus sp. GNH]
MIVMGVESSCDECSVALVEDGRKVLSNVIATQIETHKKYGGVVPEIASRMHVEVINDVIQRALDEASLNFSDVDLIGGTMGPGLVGALLVGLSAAKTLAFSLDKPFVGVNHVIGHTCANYIAHPDLEPPFVGLIVSGGHTYLIDVKSHIDFDLMGRTKDDAAGEAFDKVARVLGIGYPGGPIVDALAKKGKSCIDFPRAMLNENNYDFSFSGIKTAVINYIHKLEQNKEAVNVEDVCRSFQDCVVEILTEKTLRLAKEKNSDKIVISGGVAANQGLRDRFEALGKDNNIKIFYPSKILCTDNAAMIASCAYYTYKKYGPSKNVRAIPNLGL